MPHSFNSLISHFLVDHCTNTQSSGSGLPVMIAFLCGRILVKLIQYFLGTVAIGFTSFNHRTHLYSSTLVDLFTKWCIYSTLQQLRLWGHGMPNWSIQSPYVCLIFELSFYARKSEMNSILNKLHFIYIYNITTYFQFQQSHIVDYFFLSPTENCPVNSKVSDFSGVL
jgi:hypothetical protein